MEIDGESPKPKISEQTDNTEETGETGENIASSPREIIDSSDDDGEEIQVTQEDLKFIADDDEEEEQEIVSRKRKKKQIVDDLDDEDLELLNENYGVDDTKKWKKLRKKGQDDVVKPKAVAATDLAYFYLNLVACLMTKMKKRKLINPLFQRK